MELFDESLGFSPTDVGLHTMETIEQIAHGPEAMVRAVGEVVREVLAAGRLPILVGGEHSVSIGAFLALEEMDQPITVVQLDAHADLREEFQGSPFSHACVMARARERFPAVQLGIRSMSAPEGERVRREHLPLFTARRIHEDREDVLAQAASAIGPRIYLTIDLDVLDPSIFPSTGTPEPGGLHWEETVDILRSITAGREVVGFDLMELSPIPGLRAPDFLAAKLLNRTLGLVRPPAARG